MTFTTRTAILASLAAALAGCSTPTVAPPAGTTPAGNNAAATLRRPVLHGLALEEGLNLIDRAPSGQRLVARVVGDEIREWQVFDSSGGSVALQQKKDDEDDIPNYCHVCEMGGGTCTTPPGQNRCCLPDWGCEVCDVKTDTCKMECKTQACKDAQTGKTDGGNAPDPGDIATVLPDGSTTFFDASTSRWSLRTPTGERINIPRATSSDGCVVCTARPNDNTCWRLPCVPAKTSLYRPALP
jgi:hypothetical protein